MGVTISHREHHGIAIVEVEGQLAMGAGIESFRAFMARQTSRTKPRLLINLRGLTYLDSSGLGELMAASQSIAAAGGVVKLVNANRRINDLLQVTKLYSIFENYDDEQKALSTFDLAA